MPCAKSDPILHTRVEFNGFTGRGRAWHGTAGRGTAGHGLILAVSTFGCLPVQLVTNEAGRGWAWHGRAGPGRARADFSAEWITWSIPVSDRHEAQQHEAQHNTRYNMFIDNSLAKGLARQAVRKEERQLDRIAWRLQASNKPRPAQRLKENLKTLKRYAGRRLVADLRMLIMPEPGTGDKAKGLVGGLVWSLVRHEDMPGSRFVLTAITVDAGNGDPTERPILDVVLSEHALGSLLQRLKTTDTKTALREVSSAAAALWAAGSYVLTDRSMQGCLHTEKELAMAVGTPHGLAIATLPPMSPSVIIKTWVDDGKLHRSQLSMKALPLTEGTGITLRPGYPDLPTVHALNENAIIDYTAATFSTTGGKEPPNIPRILQARPARPATPTTAAYA